MTKEKNVKIVVHLTFNNSLVQVVQNQKVIVQNMLSKVWRNKARTFTINNNFGCAFIDMKMLKLEGSFTTDLPSNLFYYWINLISFIILILFILSFPAEPSPSKNKSRSVCAWGGYWGQMAEHSRK